MTIRRNSRAPLREVVTLDVDAGTETLSCGHTQYIAPYDRTNLFKGKIDTTLGKSRKCWGCAPGVKQ